MSIRKITTLVILSVMCMAARSLAQQPSGDIARGPQFFYESISGTQPIRLDVKRMPLLMRRITLRLENVTLDTALKAITRESQLRLVYSRTVMPLQKQVSINAEKITVAGALGEVLVDLDVDVLFNQYGEAMLVPRSQTMGTVRVVGTITGRVTDSTTSAGLGGVTVAVDGTKLATTTDAEGRYTINGASAGTQTIVARRLGYRTYRRSVTVTENQSVTADFILVRIPTALSEVVVTATGEQQRIQLGHVVGRINADSLVREAPITSVSELLTARVPGLQVFQAQGSVGGKINLQSRGPNSLSVSNEPMVVIDGIRFTTRDRGQTQTFLGGESSPGSVEYTSPLNDLNPNDIESIEVVKGPSAATLYGTDAANGVIVIKTKRGKVGPARWNTYGKMTTTEIDLNRIPNMYWGWGTVYGVADNPWASCTLALLAEGTCTQQDSVTVLPSVLRNKDRTVLIAKPTYEYGANVSGGTQDLRYYFSGDFTDATGPIGLPKFYADSMKRRLGRTSLPREWRDPNSVQNMNLRSNIMVALGHGLDVRMLSGFVHSTTNALSIARTPFNRGINRATPQNPFDYSNGSPDLTMARSSTDKVDRFITSGGGDWRPVAWLSGRATIGVDYLISSKYALSAPGDQPNIRRGSVEDSRERMLGITEDAGLQATFQRGPLSARTGVGVQYSRTKYDGYSLIGDGLFPGQESPIGATSVAYGMSYSESAIIGGYVEEMVGVNDRLFLTAAARMDGSSAFGKDLKGTVYPKFGASWVVSSEPFMPRVPHLNELRVRAALGASGQQPEPAWIQPTFNRTQAVTNNGEIITGYSVGDLGNPDLRPERTREIEFGLDASGFENRVTVELTRFGRRTTDQLITETNARGFGSRRSNLGLTTQHGFEAKIDAKLVDTRSVSFDLGVQHSQFKTKVVDLGTSLTPGYSTNLDAYHEGYSLGARFLNLYTYDDANGDGILVYNEVAWDNRTVYAGESFPPRAQTLSAILGLLDRRVRVSTLLERKTGFVAANPWACFDSKCRALTDPSTSIEDQAKATIGAEGLQSGNFVRLREVSLAVDMPQRLITTLHLNRGTLVVSGRNLHLWTKFSGTDPEVNSPSHQPELAYGIGGGGVAGGIPMGRVLSFRLDLGL